MVDARWSSDEAAYVYTVACDCGATSRAVLAELPDEEDDAPPPSAESRRTERAAWAAFVHQARRGMCRDCQRAAGRWLRDEPAFVPARARPRPSDAPSALRFEARR